ncbi:hypothetical protein [Rhodococcus sp. NPDC058521]|uniref:hypothetical protein n=1 Tax=Rhodococcus sp. NPDC058521 TaxID=3346536 RepID=UPI00365EBF8A
MSSTKKFRISAAVFVAASAGVIALVPAPVASAGPIPFPGAIGVCPFPTFVTGATVTPALGMPPTLTFAPTLTGAKVTWVRTLPAPPPPPALPLGNVATVDASGKVLTPGVGAGDRVRVQIESQGVCWIIPGVTEVTY